MSTRIHPAFWHTPYRELLPRPAPTYYRFKSMCMEIESCGGVADCMTRSASVRLFRPPDVLTGGNNTRHRLRGPKWRAHDCSRSREECPCLEDDQGQSRRGKTAVSLARRQHEVRCFVEIASWQITRTSGGSRKYHHRPDDPAFSQPQKSFEER